MHPDLKKYLTEQRKIARELLELRRTEADLKHLKNPDAKLLKLVQDEIAARTPQAR